MSHLNTRTDIIVLHMQIGIRSIGRYLLAYQSSLPLCEVSGLYALHNVAEWEDIITFPDWGKEKGLDRDKLGKIVRLDRSSKREYTAPVKYRPEVLPEEVMYDVAQRYKNNRDKMLFYTCYLSGGRISEVLKLLRRDIIRVKSKKLHGKELLVFTLRTEKNRKYPIRKAPCVIEGTSGDMANELWEWLQRFNNDDKLFPALSRTNAWNKLSKVQIHVRADKKGKTIEKDLKIYPHYLRHCRLTHLVENYNVNDIYLMYFAGWSTTAPAIIYVRGDYMRLAKEMIG